MKRTKKKMYYLLIPMLIAFGIFSGCHKEIGTKSPKPEEPLISVDCSNKTLIPKDLQIFPADNPWNKDISGSPIDPLNDQIITNLAGFKIKADFGSGLW
ncbi:MAG: hypothetical protein WBP45_16140, partial [Daejeonella sp.]